MKAEFCLDTALVSHRSMLKQELSNATYFSDTVSHRSGQKSSASMPQIAIL
jgi:hypothetical protein